jgi:hypothetical protein
VRPPRPTPAEELRTAWLLKGELEGHTLADNLAYFAAMAELEDLEEAGRGPDGAPVWLISPAVVEESGWRRLFHRRPG